MARAQEPRLETDARSLEWAAEDWGHLVHRRPRGVVRPSSVAEVVAAVRCSRGPIVARGSGHSLAGQAQTEGTVLDMGALDAIHEVGAGWVNVEAGARWSSVLRAALESGQTPPVLTDYLELTVGGTLAVGGIGGVTQHHGFQTDTVEELEVVTPDGEVRTCSRTRESELFDRVRAGGGKSGIVVRAVLRLVPAPGRVSRHQVRWSDLGAFVEYQRLCVAERRFDHLQGRVDAVGGGFEYVLDAAVFHDGEDAAGDAEGWRSGGRDSGDRTYADGGCGVGGYGVWESADWDYAEFLDQMALQEPFLRSAESGHAWYRPHPWLNLFLPAECVVDFVRRSSDELAREHLGETGLVLLYPFRTDAVTTPGIALPNGPVVFLLAVLRTADTDRQVSRMLAANQRLRERALALGGCPYLDTERP